MTIESAEGQEPEEGLSGVEASLSDLVRAKESEAMAKKTCDFGSSHMTAEMLRTLEDEGLLSSGDGQAFSR